MADPTYEALETAARQLLDALARQYGGAPLSFRSSAAYDHLRALLPKARDPLDAVKVNAP